MKARLFPLIGIILTGCSTVPVVRYSNAYKIPSGEIGFDFSFGRELGAEISSAESADEEETTLHQFPLFGISGYRNLSDKMSLMVRLYNLLGIQTGLDYIICRNSKYSIGIDFNISYFQSSNDFVDPVRRYRAISLLFDSYFSKPLINKTNLKFITNSGIKLMASHLQVNSSHFNFLEPGIFANIYVKLLFLQISPEVAYMLVETPAHTYHLERFWGIYIGLEL